MTKKRIIAFSFFPAFVRPKSGGVERLFNLYSALSHYIDITLISSAFLEGEREEIRHSSSFLEVRIPKDTHFAASYARLSKSIGSGDLSGPALGDSCRHFGALHDEYLRHYGDADIIVHDSPFLIECDLFRGFDSKTRVYNSYNCETALYRSFHSDGDEETIEVLVRRLEAEVCRHADLITVCSVEDRDVLTELFRPEASIVLAPNGYVPGPAPTTSKRRGDRVVFLGSAHQPNLDAVDYIVERIAPRLPKVEFHIIGSCRPKSRTGNVIAHGFVSDGEKKRLLRTVGAAINPMTSGGGSSLKVADIASHGVPLVSTPLGVRGFDLVEGVHYVALDPARPIDALRAVLKDPSRQEALVLAAMEHFRLNFTWPSIAEALAGQLAELKPKKPAIPRLVLNDYDSLSETGGGATRTRGLCGGLIETAPIIFLAFATDNKPCRRVTAEGRILSLLVDKLPDHIAQHKVDEEAHWISSADIVSYVHAPRNSRLVALFRCAASISAHIVCEHPYMVAIPRMFGTDFTYSSQNFEMGLKAESLKQHLRRAELLALVEEAESFACAASSLIVAVCDSDARSFGAAFRSTAPIMVVPNGAEAPAVARTSAALPAGEGLPDIIFMGSAHGPNFDAVKWIVTVLAAAMPEEKFVILGSVADNLDCEIPSNVELTGRVDDVEKSRRLYAAGVAINPMLGGSGSNVKVADFLQHGLKVVSTPFGARGYETVPPDDLVVVELNDFAAVLRDIAADAHSGSAQARHERYAVELSMDAGGRRLAELIDGHNGRRPRALYVTYRYNEPARGGGEEYVVHLINALAASGWNVDVVSPAAEQIEDVDRFAARFAGPKWQTIPTGHERVRSSKFPLDSTPATVADVSRLWTYQPDFERALVASLPPLDAAGLAWGWADSEADGRWSFQDCGLFLPASATLKLRATAIAPLWLQIKTAEGCRLLDLEIDREIDFEIALPPGFISLQSSLKSPAPVADPRPLAMFGQQIEINGRSLMDDRLLDRLAAGNSPIDLMSAMVSARRAVRDPRQLELTQLRGASDSLERFVWDHAGDYDLVVTHNAVFRSSIAAVDAAAKAGTPSVFIPHLHLDDDFYHFPDIKAACETATRTLLCPQVAIQTLSTEGLTNLVYNAPGVDLSTTFSSEDAAAFRDVLGNSDEFFLVLGRKSAAKGYHDVISAVQSWPSGKAPLIVMIGPDDDGVELDDRRVIYLGRQPQNIVRGALLECVALVNMSRSESFGMVLVEAGLAGAPVIANANCAAFADIVEQGVNGSLVTAEALATEMAKLLADGTLRAKMGKAGRALAKKRGWRPIERDFVNLCNKLVEPA